MVKITQGIVILHTQNIGTRAKKPIKRLISLYGYMLISWYNMQEEVFTVVKVRLSEIEELVRSRHTLPEVLTDIQVEGDSLFLYFREKQNIENEKESIREKKIKTRKKRRKRRKRNRMKTRGWEVVARIRNSKGQRCAIYAPFVDALNQPLPRSDQKLLVAKILKSNGNRPSETSIEYFLENTLEYLKLQRSQTSA